MVKVLPSLLSVDFKFKEELDRLEKRMLMAYISM